MYRALEFFTDVRDGERQYFPGDTYPREGLSVSAERLAELSTDQNLRGIPLIEKVEPVKVPEEPKKRGRKRNVD